jgi:hypothetical protein
VALEAGYGIKAGAMGVLTPYGGLAWTAGGAQTWRLGGRLAFGATGQLSLAGERRTPVTGPSNHTVLLELRLGL